MLVCSFKIFAYNIYFFLTYYLFIFNAHLSSWPGYRSLKVKVKPKFIQTPSTFLTLSQFIRYSLENGNKIWQELQVKLSVQTHLDNVR